MYGKIVLFRSVVSLHQYNVRQYQKDKTRRLLKFLADMPKVSSPRITQTLRQRQPISKKDQNYVPSTVYLQVLGSGAKGVPNTLYLCTDQKRYLFNCGESTQRLAHEHRVKLARLDHIFITSKTWKNIGGLPGLSLTLQDVGVPNITLHGPEGLDELYKATKRFIIMKEMNVTMAPCTPSEDFIDNVMTVKYVLLHPEAILKQDLNPAKKQKLNDCNQDKVLEEFIHDNTDYYHSERQKGHKKYTKPILKLSPERDSHKKKNIKVLNELEGKYQSTVAYICTLKKKLGSLDLEKCVEKGVKPGPLLGQLKNGQDVILPCGKLVLSKDVKTPDDPGPVFIVLEVPDISYLKEEEFALHFDNGVNPKENVPALVVHLSPPHVFQHPTYQAFLSMFGSTTRHLVVNEQNTCLGSEAVHRTQHKLNLLDTDIFPLLRDISIPAVWNDNPVTDDDVENPPWLEELKKKVALAQFQNIIATEECNKGDSVKGNSTSTIDFFSGRTLTTFHLRPKQLLDRSAEPKLHIQEYIKEAMDVDGFADSLEQYREQVSKVCSTNKCPKVEYPKVIFLGTGSCIPSKTRNTSAIVLQIDETRSMLLDCGEGTFGQLVRFFGPKRVNGFLRTLKAVYISHLHADHHIGLIGVLQARRAAFLEDPNVLYEPVHLLAPGQIVTWLSLYDQQFEKIRDDFALIPNQSLLYQQEANLKSQEMEMTSAILASMGVQSVTTCLVAHCPNAFGVTIELKGDHKITYSGDTLPCKELVDIGKNSTLLIHEATMEDELADEARVKMHSTTSQAINIGRQMNARYTMLTHFSQRYARLPRLKADIMRDNATVGIAFDNMQIKMKDLELLPLMYAPLQLMFAEHCVNMELKAAHRARQRERRPDGSPSPAARDASVSSMRSLRCHQRLITSTLSDHAGGRSRRNIALQSKRKTRNTGRASRDTSNSSTKSARFQERVKSSASNPSGTVNARGACAPSSKIPALQTTHNARTKQIDNNARLSPASKRRIPDVRTVQQISLDSRPRFNNSPRIVKPSELPKKTPAPRSYSPKVRFTNKGKERKSDEVKKENVNVVKERNAEAKRVTRRSQIESLKTSFCQDLQEMSKLTNTNQTNSACKKFKPQLEDIKSSYVLLNKTSFLNRNIEKTLKTCVNEKKIKKPEPIDEVKRRELLIKAREKYKSKRFWNDASTFYVLAKAHTKDYT